MCPKRVQAASGASNHTPERRVLSEYGGPHAFAIPGNHDWIDGLETFTNFIEHKVRLLFAIVEQLLRKVCDHVVVFILTAEISLKGERNINSM